LTAQSSLVKQPAKQIPSSVAHSKPLSQSVLEEQGMQT
jgi:hypothetical protein